MTAPKGPIGNPRAYRSKPNEEWVKDPRTGTYHKNTCYKGAGTKGGKAAPQPRSLRSATKKSELKADLAEAGIPFSKAAFAQRRRVRQNMHGPLRSCRGYDTNGFDNWDDEDFEGYGPGIREAAAESTLLADNFETLCESSELRPGRTKERMAALEAIRKDMKRGQSDESLPLPALRGQNAPTYHDTGGVVPLSGWGDGVQYADVSSDGHMLVGNMEWGTNPHLGEAVTREGAVYRFRNGNWERLCNEDYPTPSEEGLFSTSKDGQKRVIFPNAQKYGAFTEADGSPMSDARVIETMFDPPSKDVVDAAVRDMDIFIARNGPHKHGHFVGEADDRDFEHRSASATEAVDSLASFNGDIRGEVVKGLRRQKILHGRRLFTQLSAKGGAKDDQLGTAMNNARAGVYNGDNEPRASAILVSSPTADGKAR